MSNNQEIKDEILIINYINNSIIDLLKETYKNIMENTIIGKIIDIIASILLFVISYYYFTSLGNSLYSILPIESNFKYGENTVLGFFFFTVITFIVSKYSYKLIKF